MALGTTLPTSWFGFITSHSLQTTFVTTSSAAPVRWREVARTSARHLPGSCCDAQWTLDSRQVVGLDEQSPSFSSALTWLTETGFVDDMLTCTFILEVWKVSIYLSHWPDKNLWLIGLGFAKQDGPSQVCSSIRPSIHASYLYKCGTHSF